MLIPTHIQRTGPSATDLLPEVTHLACAYLETIRERSVLPRPEALAALAVLDEPLPIATSAPAETLRLLDDVITPATMATAGPRFFGFVTGGALPVALAANWLAGAWDQNAGRYTTTPGVAHLEQVALRWLVELFDLPMGTTGGLVTGGTMANFTALAAARHVVLTRVGWNVEADGLFGAPAITVIVGEEVHPTVLKALSLLGLGYARLVRVPVDGQGRMRPECLPAITGPTILCLQAGNVNTGAFDPFVPLIAQAHAAGAWVHVDGAFGLWAKAASSLRPLVHGVEHADSWATDPHKWLNVPYDSGLAFVRDPTALPATMGVTAPYLPTKTAHRNPNSFTPEHSRRARGVEVWAVLRSLGRTGLAELFERNCRQARRFADALSAAGYEILNEVVLNQVLVSFGSPERTQAVIDAIQHDGTCWCGGTVWQEQTAMRISVSNWATTDEDVERSLQAMLRLASSIAH